MSQEFNSKDDLYNKIISQLDTILKNFGSTSPSEREKFKDQFRLGVTEAEELVQQMELEVRGMPVTQREPLQKRCRTYRKNLKDMQSELGRILSNSVNSADRNRLLGEINSEGQNDRIKLVNTTDRLNATSEKIKRAQIVASDTEVVAGDIVTEIKIQGDKIQQALESLRNVNRSLTKGKIVVSGMITRMKVNRALMWIIIFILVVMIGFVIYYKWIY